MTMVHIQEVAKVIAQELLAVLQARLGPEVGRGVKTYLTELRKSVDDRLAARLSAAADFDVLQLVLDFGQEVCNFVGGCRVVLALDNGERLQSADLGLLMDLSEALPEHLRLRVAFATSNAAEQDSVDRLRQSGAAQFEVQGLNTVAIDTWLQEAGLDPLSPLKFTELQAAIRSTLETWLTTFGEVERSAGHPSTNGSPT